MKDVTQQIAQRFGAVLVALALMASLLLIFVFEGDEAANTNTSTEQTKLTSLFTSRLTPLVAKATTPKVRTEPKTKAAVKKSHATRVPVSQWATAGDMQGKIDRCIGPVAINISGAPLLIAEHDYCGGSGRIASRHMGDRVQVTGGGGVNGTYKVVSIHRVPKGSSTGVLRGLGAAVLQTCVGNTLVLVGINRI